MQILEAGSTHPQENAPHEIIAVVEKKRSMRDAAHKAPHTREALSQQVRTTHSIKKKAIKPVGPVVRQAANPQKQKKESVPFKVVQPRASAVVRRINERDAEDMATLRPEVDRAPLSVPLPPESQPQPQMIELPRVVPEFLGEENDTYTEAAAQNIFETVPGPPEQDISTVRHEVLGDDMHDVEEVPTPPALNEAMEALSPVITELFVESDTESETLSIEEVLLVTQSQERQDVALDETFAAHIAEYIHSLPEDSERAAEEQPRVIMEKIVEVSINIQELHVQAADPEVLQEKIEELTELCKQLLESLGIEADEKIVMRFVKRMLASDMSDMPAKKLSPHELAKLGTHEYKLEDWFTKFKKLLDQTLHPHHVIGRLALNMSVTFV